MNPRAAPRKPRTRDPAIPGTTKDRTGAAGILRRAGADINRRFTGLLSDVAAVFARIPVYAVNDIELGRVIYGLTPEELAATAEALQAGLDRWIAEGRETKHVLWWEPYQAEAQHLGAAQAVSNLSGLSNTYAAVRSLQHVVFSEPYRVRAAMAQVKSYEHWTGLAAGMRQELSQIIGRAVIDGKNPKAVVKEIAERLDVSKSEALQYAQTDITDTLRQARWAEAEYAQIDIGLKLGLLWTSALIPQTRPWHASRNGKVYTAAQCRAFYEERGNRYACRCAQTECLLDTDGKPIISDRAKASRAKELADWQEQRTRDGDGTSP
jgi:SPP1 gp7 family putative phage head morphogenesis protein